MNIILLGAPGSGKGTQSELLCEKNGFTQLSTGDLFRKNINNNTNLGIEAKKYMNEGKLVPDLVTNAMVKDYLKSKHQKLIFDGFPRTIDQAHALDEMLAELDSSIEKVIYIEVDESILMDRLTGRRVCEVCKRSFHIKNRKPKIEGICDYDLGKLITRPDDSQDKIKVRLDAYQKETTPLVDFYAEKIISVNSSNLSPQEVYNQIASELGF